MRIVFMGTPDFAVPCLAELLEAGHQVCGVFTQPDKPKGRKMVLTPPPVKELALEKGLPVYQPAKMRDGEALGILQELRPELIVVVAYGKILPKEILTLPPKGCVNVHGSLLPKYRGAAPIQWSVINGEKETGVTTMLMDEGLDTGDMLLRDTVKIGENETAGELFDRLAPIGAQLLLKTLEGLEQGSIAPQKQNDQESTYASMLDKNLSAVNWNKSSREVHNLIRGLTPWPTAYTVLEGKKLKLFGSSVSAAKGGAGEIVSLNPFLVGCGDGVCVRIDQVQLEGKKRMGAADFFRGHPVPLKTSLN